MLDNNNIAIVEEIATASQLVIDFIKLELQKIIESSHFDDIIEAHLHHLVIEERKPLLIEKINKIIQVK